MSLLLLLRPALATGTPTSPPPPPLGATTFTYRGARLGVNVFQVTAHSGAAGLAESEPAEVTITLLSARAGAWMLVGDDDSGAAMPFDPTGVSSSSQATVETFRPPGRPYPLHHHWGTGGRQVSVQARYLPSEDGSLSRFAEQLLDSGGATYLKAQSPYDLDVIRGRVTSAGPTSPQPNGFVDVSMTVDEIAPEKPG